MLSLILKKGRKATIYSETHGYIDCTYYFLLKWNNDWGMVYPKALSSDDPAWRSSILCWVSLGKIIYIRSSGRNLEYFINLEHFVVFCVRPIHYLCKSTEFHYMRIGCKIIIIHFLLLLSHKLTAIDKCFPCLYFSLVDITTDMSALFLIWST